MNYLRDEKLLTNFSNKIQDSESKLQLIPPEKRLQSRCHYCGETRSVKYLVDVYDPVVSTQPTQVACCNKCAATLLHRTEEL